MSGSWFLVLFICHSFLHSVSGWKNLNKPKPHMWFGSNCSWGTIGKQMLEPCQLSHEVSEGKHTSECSVGKACSKDTRLVVLVDARVLLWLLLWLLLTCTMHCSYAPTYYCVLLTLATCLKRSTYPHPDHWSSSSSSSSFRLGKHSIVNGNLTTQLGPCVVINSPRTPPMCQT